MSKINTKSLMVLSIVSLSLISMPIMVMGAQNQDDSSPLQQPGPGFIQGFTGGFGNLFANPLLGKGGEILGTIFKLLFMFITYLTLIIMEPMLIMIHQLMDLHIV
ncbi:MAG: hypothetical protein P8Y97_04725 [Candidatus Lokiarchaeota archaeon]